MDAPASRRSTHTGCLARIARHRAARFGVPANSLFSGRE